MTKPTHLLFAIAILSMAFINKEKPMNKKNANLYAPVKSYIAQVILEFDQIPEERKKALKKLALFVESKVKAGETARLIFICTHNSRRSHISQIWAQTAAAYYNIPQLASFSGGTEATAFNTRAVKAMREAGFQIKEIKAGDNPVYEVQFAEDVQPVLAFSKQFSHEANPQENFCAIMTCSEADKNCPIVPGASLRVALPYEDPKNFDDTSQEAEKYRERVQQIAREIFYAFSLINA